MRFAIKEPNYTYNWTLWYTTPNVALIYCVSNNLWECEIELVTQSGLTMEASMGRKSVVVAVLLEHSVNMATSRHSTMEMAKGGMFFSGVSICPIHPESPDTFITKEKKISVQSKDWFSIHFLLKYIKISYTPCSFNLLHLSTQEKCGPRRS